MSPTSKQRCPAPAPAISACPSVCPPALPTAPEAAPQRAIYLANLAACSLKQSQWAEAAEACTAALDLDPGYLKALVRRSEAFERVDELEPALADINK